MVKKMMRRMKGKKCREKDMGHMVKDMEAMVLRIIMTGADGRRGRIRCPMNTREDIFMNVKVPQETVSRSGECRDMENRAMECQVMERMAMECQVMEHRVRECHVTERHVTERAAIECQVMEHRARKCQVTELRSREGQIMEDRARPVRSRECRVKDAAGADRSMDLRGTSSGAMEDRGKEWEAMMSCPAF